MRGCHGRALGRRAGGRDTARLRGRRGIGDTLALLMADRAFSPDDAAVAKLAVLTGSAIAAIVGILVLRRRQSGLRRRHRDAGRVLPDSGADQDILRQ
jgi:hypothetical protein